MSYNFAICHLVLVSSGHFECTCIWASDHLLVIIGHFIDILQNASSPLIDCNISMFSGLNPFRSVDAFGPVVTYQSEHLNFVLGQICCAL